MLYPNVEVRHLHAVIVLAEELNFTRAAIRLNICQPALSKQMAELEKGLGFPLFLRQRKKIIDLSEPGRVFVEEARSAVFHAERAVHMARSISHGSETVLTVGHSPFADRAWVSTLLALRLPLYPNLRLRLKSRFATDLARGVISGELDLAIVTAPPNDPRITAAVFVRIPLYVALPESHRTAPKKAVNGVTKPDIDLHWNARSGQLRLEPNAHAIVFVILFNPCALDGLTVEHDTVCFFNLADRSNRCLNFGDCGGCAAPEEIQILRGPVSVTCPQSEERGPFEGKLIPV